MKIAKTAARRKPSPIISTDNRVISYLGRRFRLRPLVAVVVAEAIGLGAR